jgi:hypothetical protein
MTTTGEAEHWVYAPDAYIPRGSTISPIEWEADALRQIVSTNSATLQS